MRNEIRELSDWDLDEVNGGMGPADLHMIQLQTLASQRQPVIQETAQLVATMDATTKSVIKHIPA